MDIKLEPQNIEVAKPAWHRPTLTPIVIKLTLYNSGTPIDGDATGSE